MSIETKILLCTFVSTVIGLAWKGAQSLAALIEKTDDARWPSIWKFHNRLTGWSTALLLLLFSTMAFRNFLHDAGMALKTFNLICAFFALGVAPIFAYFQHRVWVNKSYGRLAKVGPLDGSI